MWRVVTILIVLVLLGVVTSCGDGTFILVAGTHFSASGSVSIVHFTIIDGNTQLTVVTLVTHGFTQTLNFCGNVLSQFPTDAFVTVTYTQGDRCATLVRID